MEDFVQFWMKICLRPVHVNKKKLIDKNKRKSNSQKLSFYPKINNKIREKKKKVFMHVGLSTLRKWLLVIFNIIKQ